MMTQPTSIAQKLWKTRLNKQMECILHLVVGSCSCCSSSSSPEPAVILPSNKQVSIVEQQLQQQQLEQHQLELLLLLDEKCARNPSRIRLRSGNEFHHKDFSKFSENLQFDLTEYSQHIFIFLFPRKLTNCLLLKFWNSVISVIIKSSLSAAGSRKNFAFLLNGLEDDVDLRKAFCISSGVIYLEERMLSDLISSNCNFNSFLLLRNCIPGLEDVDELGFCSGLSICAQNVQPLNHAAADAANVGLGYKFYEFDCFEVDLDFDILNLLRDFSSNNTNTNNKSPLFNIDLKPNSDALSYLFKKTSNHPPTRAKIFKLINNSGNNTFYMLDDGFRCLRPLLPCFETLLLQKKFSDFIHPFYYYSPSVHRNNPADLEDALLKTKLLSSEQINLLLWQMPFSASCIRNLVNLDDPNSLLSSATTESLNFKSSSVFSSCDDLLLMANNISTFSNSNNQALIFDQCENARSSLSLSETRSKTCAKSRRNCTLVVDVDDGGDGDGDNLPSAKYLRGQLFKVITNQTLKSQKEFEKDKYGLEQRNLKSTGNHNPAVKRSRQRARNLDIMQQKQFLSHLIRDSTRSNNITTNHNSHRPKRGLLQTSRQSKTFNASDNNMNNKSSSSSCNNNPLLASSKKPSSGLAKLKQRKLLKKRQ